MKQMIILCLGLILSSSLTLALNCTDPSCLECNQAKPQECLRCIQQTYYLETDHTCKQCSFKIRDCTTCTVKKEEGDSEAQVQCTKCTGDYTLSNDNRQCYLPKYQTIIIITAVAAFLLLVSGGVAVYLCARRKKTMFKDGEYQKV